MAEQVERMVQGRESLTHGVSHALRTPLARLRFALELIDLADDAKGRSKRIREATDDVEKLEALVRELLTYSSLHSDQAPAIATEPADVQTLLKALVTDARRVGPEITLEITMKGDNGEVSLDVKLFLRVVRNLVNNAMRYADGSVIVTLRRAPTYLAVLVDDDGPSVPEEEPDNIFEPFSRLDAARRRDTDEIGLDLPIAAGAAKAHRGCVEVRDSPLGGAQFAWVMTLD